MPTRVARAKLLGTFLLLNMAPPHYDFLIKVGPIYSSNYLLRRHCFLKLLLIGDSGGFPIIALWDSLQTWPQALESHVCYCASVMTLGHPHLSQQLALISRFAQSSLTANVSNYKSYVSVNPVDKLVAHASPSGTLQGRSVSELLPPPIIEEQWESY